ncbi:glucosyl-3-phosphoglycerate synthase [Gordonia polyisoprenivorans NBRC 16320 = JCM 10675]|uniref:Glucosyl-3-phosphoglycerate synthase n=1 Tax=Gordonia polyisoprenivorans TaxID=84595 RepID=A0A846WTN8_9ACTN|nr:glucosyl-3-phosphoglycerate synthase [Gordonia polyisoprenivorans]NKY03751.1 glucosyl-3-phosphoglycerate synthase [Gordonia polyisoprenivorans]OZC31237.1 glucosyl-3-phosphoglycerate synthase [Gordonia polyisoprenivorans]UZF54550.1 glucosyl-3-phosphoglycerate synthase [Gordonia polyisoprenivorans]GAB21083.1 glucosyl-3-phosphoglycerate synthase [Gordonia polyisoprenivorans NBRC 16320 = JCM 10675]
MTKKVRRTQNRPHVAGRTPTASTGRDKAAMWPAPADTADRGSWSTTHTWEQPDWTIDDLVAAKDGRTVSVVLPALNEEETVADVIATIRPLLGTLVDELIVLDSGSTDATVERARAAGAEVISREDAVPELEPVKGKGEVLWRSIAVATGDIIAFVDSDLIDPDPMFVPKMLGPLLVNPDIQLVKGYYRRPLRTGGTQDANGGGRVTELVARPLLASQKPELTAVLQPLGGEYAGTREMLASVPFAPGYGVEIGLLIDTYDRYGLEGIGQVNLGVRTHRNRPLIELGVMSRQIVGTLMRRCGIEDSGVGLTQFTAEPDGTFTPHTTDVYLEDRPPMKTLRAVDIAADDEEIAS